MGLRDAALKLASQPARGKIVDTVFGKVEVRLPAAARVDQFRKDLGDSAGSVLNSQAGLVAVCAYDPGNGEPVFGSSDIEPLSLMPAVRLAPIIQAMQELDDTPNPPTAGAGTGSG